MGRRSGATGGPSSQRFTVVAVVVAVAFLSAARMHDRSYLDGDVDLDHRLRTGDIGL